MKKSRFLLSTLFAAAALSVAPAVPTLADGDGSQSNPYTGSVGGLTDMFDSSKFAAGSTVYINGITAGYFGSANTAYTCVADINIGSKGMTLTNGYSEASYTFTGKITGTGDWKFSASGVSQDYIFLGDMSGYSGNIDYTGERHDNASYPSYFYFGNGGTAATDTNISGTGSITHNETVIFNYSGYATQGSTAITIGNSSITAEYLTFTGSVNYNISSALKGTGGSSSSLTISTSGTVTLSGDVSDFASVTVSSGSTLAFDGAVSIGSAITNSGTVTLNESVIFVLDDMSFTGDWSTGATYTLVTGGTINIDGTALTSSSTLSFGTDNLYVALGTIDSFTFNYDGTSLTVTVTGEEIVNGLNGDGTIDSPYFTHGDGTVSITDSGDSNIFPSSGTLYLATDTYSFGNSSENIYLNGTLNATCDIVIGAAGVYLTNATSSHYYNFTGSISGTGSWTHGREGSSGSPALHYAFAGDLSGWSGDFTITYSNANDIIIFGGTINGVNNDAITGVTGVVAATGTNVSGTGAISVGTGTVQFNYVKPTAGATGYDTLTIGNSSITANSIVFAGDVDYVISAGTTITSASSSGSLTVSTEGGTVTILGTLTTGSTSNCFSSLSVAEGSTLRIGADNTFYTDTTSTAGNVFVVSGTLEIAEGVSFTVRKRTAATGFSIADLSLENGSTFTLFTEGTNAPSASNQGISVGTLTVDGSTKIVTSNWHNYVGIGTLIGEDATLTLDSTAGSNSATIFELGGSNTSSQFTGTITLAEDATGNYRGVTLIISDEKVASGAVIEMGTEYNTNDSIALGVNASRVEIAGLVSSNSGGDIVYSGYVSLGATFGDGGATLIDYNNQSGYGEGSNYDGVGTTTNTLVINVASGESYSFAGTILNKVNIEKGGKGTQAIAFSLNKWQSSNYFDGSIAVTGGTLELSGVAISSSGISVSSGATLSIANQITLASGSSSTIAGNLTVTGDGSLSVSSGATLDLSDATVSLSSTITNSGTVTVNSSTVFLIDDLTGGVSDTYTLISGGTITGWDNLTSTNFSTDTRATITVGDSGTITYASGAASLVWNGSSGDVWELEGGYVWLNGGSADSFYNDDTVTFNSSAQSSTVIVSGTVKPGSITVDSNYTFTVVSGDSARIDTSTLTIASGTTLTIDKGVTIYFDIGTVKTFSISGIAGTGTLEFEFNSDYSSTIDLGNGSTFAGEVYIVSGNLQLGASNIGNGSYRVASGVNLQSSGAVSIPGLIIEGDTTLSKANSETDDTSVSITSFVIENGATLTFYTNGDNPSSSTQGLLIGTLTVSGDSATMKTDYWQNYVSIGTLVGTDATLNLGSTSSSSVATIYELTGTGGTSSFTGTISLSDTNTSNSNRGVTLIISNASVAAGAVIEMGSELSSDTLALGVNAETVEIAGLVSGGSGNNGADVVYSGYVSLGTELGNAGHDFSNTSGMHYGIIGNDGTGTYANVGKSTNTLVINTAANTSYSFTGVFLDKLNIEKKGEGTQAINFEDESYFDGKITVSAGTLSISGSVGASEISVASGANLELTGEITLSSTISNSGTVVVNSDTVFVLDNLSGVETGEGTVYTIISNTSGTIVGWENLTDSNFVTGSHATVTIGTGDAAGTVTIVEGFAADLIWNATVDMVWDRTTKNWLNNGSQDKFAEHDSVTFTTTGQGTVTVESEGVIANIVTVSSGTYSFTGGDITAESFVIESGATVSLSGSLIYSDFVVSGTLKLDTQIDKGESGEIHGTITIDNDGRVELNVGDATGYNENAGVTSITVNSGGTLYVGTTSNQTLGSCDLILVGGTVTGVSGSNIDLFHSSKLTAKAADGATTDNPTVSTVTNVMLTSRNDSGTLTVEVGDNAKLLVESGFWSGPGNASYNGNIAKTGAGTLEVSGYFALNTGKLDIQEGSVILSGTAGHESQGYDFASAVSISAGASLEMDLTGDASISNVTGSGDFIKSGSTSLTVSNYGVTGSTTVSDGKLILSGDSTIGGTVTIAGALEVVSGASLTLEGTLGGSDSTGTVTFADGAKLIISDSFLGSGIEITVNENGTTSVTSGGTITIVEASTIIFGSTTLGSGSADLDSLLESFVQYSDDYTLEWAYSNGALTATITGVDVKTYLLPTTPDSSSSPSTSNGVMAAGYYIIDPRDSNTSKQGWMAPLGTSGTTTSLSFEEGSFFYGEGLFGITCKVGSSSIVETIDLTNVDASNLTGQLIVMNEWNNELDVKILGDSWANVEFLFGNAVDDETLAAKYGLTDTGLTRGDLNNKFDGKTLEDVLALQGDTTLAGVTGATKGATTHGTDNVDVTLCDHETITVASNGTTLTIAGSEEYAFWGTVGSNSNRVTISMTGSGTQTFGGTNYLQHVFVSDGNLIIAGNADVASTTTVSGGTLTVGCSSDDEGQSVSFNSSVTVQADGTLAIAGTVYFSEVVSNSGTVTIDSDSATFVVDNLTMGTSGETSYYEIISGSGDGTIDASGISISNFTGGEVTSQWAVGVSGGSLYIYYTVSEEVVWNGNETTNSWTTDQNVLDWRAGSTSIAFTEGEDVTFGSTATNKTVSIAEAIVAGAVKVTALGYVFEFSDGGSVTASGLTVESSASLELKGTGTLTVVDSLDISGTITVDAGASINLTSFELGSLASYGSANILGTGTIIVAGVSGNNVGVTLNEEFAGTLRVTTGRIDFGTGYSSVGDDMTIELVASGSDTSLCMQATSTEVKNNIIVTGDSGTLELRGGDYTGVVISGTFTSSESGVTIRKNGGGDLTFTGAVDIAGTYNAYQGTTTFASDTTTIINNITANANSPVINFTGASATVGTLNFNNAGLTVNFSGTGEYTVGTMNISENATLSGTVTITDVDDTSNGGTFTIAEGSNITVTGTFQTADGYGSTIALEKNASLNVGTLTNAWGSNFTLAEGSVIETTSASFATYATNTVTGSGTWKSTSFEFSNWGTYTFDGVSLNVTTLTMAQGASLTLTGGATFTIGTYQQTDASASVGTTFAIGANTTVDVGTFTVSWHQNTTTLGDGAVLNVTGELSLHTDNLEEFTGGTINAEKLNVYHGSSASFSNGVLNIGSGGIVSDGDNTTNCYVAFGDNLTVGVYAGTSSTATTSWIASATIQFTGTGSGTTFVTNADESITLSGTISGEGSLTKTGAGTLTISGTNTNFTGSITLAEGTLAIENNNALGSSTLTLGEGTVLTSTSSITLSSQSYIIAGNTTISGITLAGGTVSDWAAGAQVTLSDGAIVNTSGTWSITFADDTDFTYDGVILFVGTSLAENTDLSSWTATYTGKGYDSFGTGTFKVDSNGNIIFVASDEYLGNYASLVWDADSSKDQTWTYGTFQSTTSLSDDRNYIFNESSAGATSTLFGSIKTNRVTIASGAEEITWTTETSSTSISGTDLNIEVGATLNFTPGTSISDFALNFTNISLSGALVYAGAATEWETVTFGYNTASLTLDTTGAITIKNLVAETAGTISSTGGTLTIANLSGTGDVAIGGTSTGTVAVSLGGIADYSGTISLVDDGTGSLKLTLTTGNNYDDNGQVTFSIGSGTTLDINGIADTSFNVILAGGTLTSAGDIEETRIQVPNISLTADSTIDTGSHSFGMLAREFAATSLDLGGNTLTKTGTGTFFLYNTVITGAGDGGDSGTILVSEGTLKMESVTATNTNVSVSEGASLTVAAASNGSTTTTTTLGSLDSAGSVEVASNYTLGITGDSTISGSLVLNGGSTLAVSGTNVVVDLTGVTSSQAGGSGTLIISDGATVKVSNLAHGYGGRTTSFGSDMFNGLLQIADGGVLEVTAALDSSDEKSGKRGFSITSGTGTYRYSGEGTSYIVADGNRNIHLADGATLVFDVVEADSVLDVSMLIANGMSSTGDVGDSATTSTGSLQKTGAGTLVISGSNLYSGGTTISAGTLKVQSDDALGTGSITIEENGTLALDNTSITFTLAKISGSGTLIVSEGNKLSTTGENLALSGNTEVENSAELDVAIAEGETMLATTIEVEEGGTLAMTASSGTVTLSTNVAVDEGGNFTFTASATSTTVSGEISVEDSGSFTLTSSSTTTFDKSSKITVEGDFTASITGDTTTLLGEVSGSGKLTKTGSGTLVLGSGVSIANIAMSAGTLSGLALSNGMTATVSGGTLDSFTVADGGTLISDTDSISVTGNSTLSGGTISISGSSSDAYFTVASDASVTITGAVTFDLTDVSFSSSGAAIVIFDSGVTFGNGISVNNLTLNFGGSSTGGDPHFSDDTGFKWDESTGSLSVVIEMKSIDLYWEGSAETGGNILAAEGAEVLHDENNAYTFFRDGDTIYFDGSQVAVTEVTLGSDINAAAIYVQNGADITLGTNSGAYSLIGDGGLSVGSTSSLTLADANHSYTGATTVDGSLTLEITEASGSGQLFASLVSGSGSLTLDIADGLEISIADNLTGDENQLISGSLTFIKSGAGTLVVDAGQTGFTGEVQITGGTMVIASSGLFGTEATIAIDEDGTLEITADIDSLTETLSGTGTLLVDENLTLVADASIFTNFTGITTLSDGATLSLGSDSEATIGTAITGTGTLVKTGSGTVNLASGTTVTTINLTAGTLGNVELREDMTLTATKDTTLSSITMTGGTLDVTDVFDDPTASITLSGTSSFSGGTVLLGEGTLLEDGVQSEPIVAAFVISSNSTVSVFRDIVFSIDNVELPDAVFDDEGKREYSISYQVFATSSGTLEGWTDLIYSNFAIDGVVLSGSERARVELADDGSVKFYLTDYDLTWNGGESGVWNTSDVVWTRDEGYYTESYDNGDSVTFTNEFGKLNITLGGDVNPMTLTVAEDADVTIIGGEYKITGSKTKIVIEENGKLTLTSGGNDFGGGVTINDGGELALKVSSNEAYLDGVEISLADGASGTFTIDTDANVTYETILKDTTLTDSENLTIVKDGSGTLTITTDLDYSSLDLEVKSGTLKIAANGSVGSVDINLSGSANLELENTDAENPKTIENSISGVGSATTIVKTGEGEIIIAGDNSGFSGSVEIYEGTLTLSSADALGNVTKTTIAEDGTLKLDIESDFDLDNIVGTVAGSGTIEIDLGEEGVLHATSGYYGSDKFADFTGSFVVHGADNDTYTMEIDVSSTSRGSAIGDANVEIDENVNLVFNIQSAGYSYGGSISGKGTVSFKWNSNSSVSHSFSLTGDNSNFSGTIYIPEDIVLTAKGGNALGGEEATVDNSGELWIDEDDKSSVVSKLTGSGSLHKTGSGAVKIYNADNDLSGPLEIRGGALCFAGTATLGNIAEASVSEGAVLELEVVEVDNPSDNEFNVTVSGEGSVVVHGANGTCVIDEIKPYAVDGYDDYGYSTYKVTFAKNSSSSYNGGLTVDSAYLITSKTSSYDSMNELGTSTVTITNNSTWDASSGGLTASGSRTITIENHSRLLAGAFKAESGDYGSISISNIRIDSDADDAADLCISVTSSSDITRNYITGTGDGKIYMTGVDIYLDTTITSFGQITVIDTSEGLEIVGTPNVYINGELESESYWINGVISQDSISEDVKKHGLSYAAMVVMPTEAFIQDVRTIHSRLEQRRFAFSREGEWEFFAQAQTIQEDSGSGSDSKSFDYQTYGAIVGADVRIDQTTIFGMALAYDHGDAKLHHGEGHIKMDDYRFTAFASKVFANWLFVEGGGQFGMGSYDIRRRAGSTVGDNNGDTDGVNVGGFFNFGGVLPITDNLFLTPYIGFTYMYSHVDSFDETGSYGYSVDGFDANSLRGKIGTQLRAELALGEIPTALSLGLSYAHEFIDDDIDYDVAAINYSDKKQSLTENAFTEDLISIGVGAEFGLSDSASVFMGYNADIGLGNSEVSHAVNAGLKVTF